MATKVIRDAFSPSKSSVIKRATHCEDGTLVIEFRHGGDKVNYKDVETLIFEQFKLANSAGRYYNDWIKGIYKSDHENHVLAYPAPAPVVSNRNKFRVKVEVVSTQFVEVEIEGDSLDAAVKAAVKKMAPQEVTVKGVERL